MDNILVINSPYVPSYFNAGHHLPIFEVGEYLRKNSKNIHVTCLDAGALIYTWKELGDYFYQNSYKMIAIMIDFDTSDNFERMLDYIKELTPKSKILVFGRLCKQIPEFFKKFNIDGIVTDGDFEFSVLQFWKYICGNINIPAGCSFYLNGEWVTGSKGKYLDVTEWVFPDLKEIPFECYSKLYLKDSNKFCGIPNKKELVIHVSRGCPINCKFCDVSEMQGTVDRRLSPDMLCEYIIENFTKYQFEYVSMYSAIFTLNKEWTIKFCELMQKKGLLIPWKCVTTIEHLSLDCIEKMAKANCIRISIGIENFFENEKILAFPEIKKNTIEKFEKIVEICKHLNVELNCFVMLGIPGISVEESMKTIEKLNKYNVRIRPTIYTPYYEMNSDMQLNELSKFNRQLLGKSFSYEEKLKLYNIIFGDVLKNKKVDKSLE